MIPFLDLGAAAFLAALLQGLALVAIFSAFGALLFRSLLAPPGYEPGPGTHDRGLILARASLVLACLVEIAWLGAVAASLASRGGAVAALAILPTVITETSFGRVALVQILLLALALCLPKRPVAGIGARGAMLAAGAAVVLQAWHLHGAAMTGGISLLLVAEILHVLAAALWLGSLLPLLLFLRERPAAAAAAARRYSPFGAACVLVLAATGFYQGLRLMGSISDLWSGAYGWIVLFKVALFLVLIGIAWTNRFRLAPRLTRPDAAVSRAALVRNIACETAIGLLVVLAAALLASLSPPLTSMTM